MPGFSVEGPDGIAGPPTRPPVVVAGVDGTGKIRRLLTGTDGTVQVSAAGGGGAATIADGADVAQGSTADAAWVSGSGTVIALLKKIASAGGSAISVADGADVAQGTTTDLSSANTVIGILKAIKAAITGTVTTTTSWASAQHVIVDTAPTTAVTVATLPALSAGAAVIGHVIVDSGAVTSTLAAETTKVIGTVNVAASQTIAVTQATATNLKVDASGVAVPVTDNSGSLTVDAPVGTPVFTRLSDGAAALIGQKAMTASLPVVLASDQASVPVASTLAAETTKVIGTVNQGGTWTVQPGNTANTTAWLVKDARAATPTQSTASVTNANTSILASNANRLGATIWNEGAATALVKLGATASATSYSVSVASGGYYEVPFNYTGAIDGITASGTATLRVTELAA